MNETPVVDSRAALLAIIATGTLGVASFLILPSIVIGMVTDFGFDQRQIGNVSTWQLIGLAVASLINLDLVKRFSWRGLSRCGLLGLALTDGLSMFVNDYALFLPLRFAAGLAGGICVSFAAYALGQTLQSDRNFGWFLTFQVSFAIIGMFTLPSLIAETGTYAVFATLVILEVVTLLVLLPHIPAIRRTAQRTQGSNSTRIWMLCLAVLAAIAAFYTALGGFWTYVAPIGMDAGLGEAQTGRALSIGLFGGLGGAYLAAVLHVRLGRALPVILAVGAMFTALWVLWTGFAFTAFTLAALLFCFGWYMLFPYQLGLLAALDNDGRPMILANAVAGIGSGIGPFIVAQFLDGGFLPAYVICAALLAVSVTMMLSVIAVARSELRG